jgi:DNA-binding NarL/FixJ family response regulator
MYQFGGEWRKGVSTMAQGNGEIGLWIIEDDLMFRKGIKELIDGTEGMKCEGAFGNCEDALKVLQKEGAPQIVLVDIGLPGMSGIDGILKMKTLSPSTEYVVLTIHEDHRNVFEAICAGASGYLVKSLPPEEIIAKIQEVVEGGVPMSPVIARQVLTMLSDKGKPANTYHLTERETDVLNLMVEGLTRKEIAERLFISPSTVLTHCRNIHSKLHVHSRGGAVAKALKERLL